MNSRVIWSAGEITKKPVTFELASFLAERIIDIPFEADNYHIFYAQFVSSIAFSLEAINLMPYLQLEKQPDLLKDYEFEEDNQLTHMRDFAEFQLASFLFGAIVEGYASELASRSAAMDGATKNAGEMLKRLTIKYNRTRQAKITTELTEVFLFLFVCYC